MASPQPSPSRRRTYDYSHQPEQGLQEWTSRIKSIQAEVDRDEEAEQRRLEEEIAASRRARAQRREAKRLSSGLPPDPDPAATPDPLVKVMPLGSPRTRTGSPGLSPARSQVEPEPMTPDSPTKPTFGSARTVVVNPGGLGAPMSLATFIGGRATGPRLNKPTPQVDSRDATLFDQTPRTGVSVTAAALKTAGTDGRTSGRNLVSPSSRSAAAATIEPSLSVPVSENPVPHSPRASTSVEQPIHAERSRTRTLSSPTKATSSLTQETETAAESDPFKSNELIRSRRKSTATSIPSSPPKSTLSSSTLGSAFSTPPPRARTKSGTSPAGSTFSTGTSPTLGLARAIQPSPPVQDTKKFPLVTASSPAFRSTLHNSAKELSPSLTRLQGRGFVGKVRQAAESSPDSTFGPSSQFGERERERPTRGKIQERWHAAIQSTSPSSEIPAWKRRIVKEPVPFPTVVEKPKPSAISAGLFASPKSVNRLSGNSSSTSLADEFRRKDPSSPSPPSPSRILEPAAHKEPPSGSADMKLVIQPKPLNHLTKDRARKPKKNVHLKEMWGAAPETARSTTPVGPPPENRSPSPFRRGKPAISSPLIPPSSLGKSLENQENALPKSPITLSVALPPSPNHAPIPVFAPQPEPSESKVSRARDMWAERSPIGVKVPVAVKRFPSILSASPSTSPGMVGKRALPGMASPTSIESQTRPQIQTQPQPQFARPESQSPFVRPVSPEKPTILKPIPPSSPKPTVPPASPGRHLRAPSTGNRATVMEVAQTMIERQEEQSSPDPASPSPSPSPSSTQTEHRRSSYEKYSSIIMPSLKEEKTPLPTPAGTMSKAAGVSPEAPPVVLPKVKEPESVYHVDQTMAPIPPFDIQQVLSSNPYTFVFPSNLKRISTDVFTISNGQAALVSSNPCLVYESELVAVVQRVKNERNGLVQNKVWGWQGKKAASASGDVKLSELAKQYGTTVAVCAQGEESEELVDAVGGHWIVRQGTRAHWTPGNTTMHCTRQMGDAYFTDEVDFHVSNLCSAYSYCITALDAIYVWHGRGSTANERDMAKTYAKCIAGPEKEADEFDEGNEDPMLFMLLGEDPWANADYWKYRASLSEVVIRPRMFCIDARNKKRPVSCYIPSPSKLTPDSISVLDSTLELFVLVGSGARARRTDILLGVHIAVSIAAAVEHGRPYTLPVHLVVLPSQIPLDVKAGYFRFLENERVNISGVPSHMNILTLQDASQQLSAATWPQSRLEDHDFLPLGLHPKQIV